MSDVARAALPRRRVVRIAVLAAFALAAAAGASWYGWLWYTTPAPPAVPLDGAEPAVAQAVQTARGQVRQNGQSAAAWGRLGQVLSAHGFDAQADVCFARAEGLDPKEVRWPYYQGMTRLATDPEAALPFFRRAADRSDPGDFCARLRLAEALLQTGAYEEAETQFRLVPAFGPDGPRVHYGLGLAAQRRRDDSAALQELTAAAASPFARQKAYATLAAVQERLGSPTAAAECNRLAAATPPDSPWPDRYVTELLGVEVSRKGRYVAAEKLEAQGRRDEALAILLDLAKDATDAHAQIAAGKALDKLGRFDEAESHFRAAVGLAGERVEANYSLAAELYMKAEREKAQADTPDDQIRATYREALRYADHALALKSDHALAHFFRGLCLRRLNGAEEAVAEFRKAVACRPDLMDPQVALAETLADVGRTTEAVAVLRQASLLAPNDPRPLTARERIREAGAKAGPK